MNSLKNKVDQIPSLKTLNQTLFTKDVLNVLLEELDLSIRARNALANAGLKTVDDFLALPHHKLLSLRNAGITTIEEICKGVLAIDPNNMRIQTSMEDKLLLESDEERSAKAHLNNINIRELPLSVRLINALEKANLMTVGEVQFFIASNGLSALWKLKNVGRKSITEYKDTINQQLEKLLKGYSYNIKSALDEILAGTPQNVLEVIKDRFGFDTGKWKTLEATAKKRGCTRERIRQIADKWLERIVRVHRNSSLGTILENLERMMLNYKGIVSVIDLYQDSFFKSENRRELSFLFKLVSEGYPARYKIVDEHFLTNLDNEEIEAMHRDIKEAALECGFPIDEEDFYSCIAASLGNISQGYLAHHLITREHIEIIKGEVISLGRLTYCDRIEFIMNRFNKPMHFEEIARLYKNQFNEPEVQDFLRVIYSKLNCDKRFIIVGVGTYMLRSKFIVPSNMNQIVSACRKRLRELSAISDTKFLLLNLKQLNVDTGNLNEYSLKHLLLEHGGFVGYLKFQIGIDEFEEKCERKDMFQVVYEVLDKANAPLTVRQIWKEIRKRYGYPESAVSQKLHDTPEFIKVRRATYALKKHLQDYDNMFHEIERFVKEWIAAKQRPISTFLVTEALRGAEIIPHLPDGLAEHVLSLHPGFIKVRRGYFDLADNVKVQI